jgi:uncharacterized RDD family membrane protein YckC
MRPGLVNKAVQLSLLAMPSFYTRLPLFGVPSLFANFLFGPLLASQSEASIGYIVFIHYLFKLNFFEILPFTSIPFFYFGQNLSSFDHFDQFEFL